jgi:hypothetical protein
MAIRIVIESYLYDTYIYVSMLLCGDEVQV